MAAKENFGSLPGPWLCERTLQASGDRALRGAAPRDSIPSLRSTVADFILSRLVNVERSSPSTSDRALARSGVAFVATATRDEREDGD